MDNFSDSRAVRCRTQNQGTERVTVEFTEIEVVKAVLEGFLGHGLADRESLLNREHAPGDLTDLARTRVAGHVPALNRAVGVVVVAFERAVHKTISGRVGARVATVNGNLGGHGYICPLVRV